MQNKKKLFISVILAALTIALFVFTASANAIGDVDNDKSVTASDARLALRAAVKLENFAAGSAEFLASDVDFDNSITSSDARLILRAAVKLETLKEKPADQTAHTHVWSDWTAEKNSKGVVTGYHTRTCSAAGCTVKTERVKCSYGEKKYTTANTAPTCKDKVQYYVECSVCKGKAITQIDALNHKNKKLEAARSKAATCTEAGWNVYYCPDCKTYGDEATGKDRAALYEALDALGHTVQAGTVKIATDTVCTRCNKVLTPSFNSLVNVLKNGKWRFRTITKLQNNGTLSKFDFSMSTAMQMIMSAAASEEGEEFSVEGLKQSLEEQLASDEIIYSDYEYNPILINDNNFPVPEKDLVSALKDSDGTIKVEEMRGVDFVSELDDQVKLSYGEGLSNTRDITYFKALIPTDANITKITVTTNTEKYSSFKDNDNETILMRITGQDIRKTINVFSEELSPEDGFETNVQELTSNCAVSYYFRVDEKQVDGDTVKTYTPVAAKYATSFDVKQNVKLSMDFSLDELGEGWIVSLLQFVADKALWMRGDIDLTIDNSTNQYYLFESIA
ncbi:MAG: dockerin type I repeat-containing protein [Clostridia bacterium]|nr:dockerin type I repeat-containing protein [Clostridia bacterium]